MSKAQLPFFPKEITNITPSLSFRLEDEKVVYFNNGMPIFMHDKDDIDSFRMITAQFCETGNAKQCEIAKAFGVTEISVKRAVKLYREKGPRGFYKERKSRGPAVLTPAVLAEAQQLLDQDLLPADVAKQLGIKPDTLSKAIRDGRLRIRSKIENKTPVGEAGEVEPSTKSSRSAQDSAAPMGMGACAIEERLAASLGGALKAVTPSFQPVLDVPNGGLLLALPALLAIGLLTSTELFIAPKGYYGLDSLFMLLSFMALSRKKSIESLRYSAPGEWGKLLGLDRIPEVRTLRNKLHQLSNDNTPEVWSATLCRKWMEAAPEQAATLYVDGHVRVYNGHQTKLPRHYVARQKLCLRATTDYWVNAMDGQPFCVINQVVDPGLIEVIQQQILPRLQNDVPNQPSNNDLASNPLLHRFTLVFDREGYSPDLLKTMKDKRVACLSYHKYPGENWPEEEFKTHSVKLSNGQIVEMKLAERGTCLSNR